jgi:predicted trehalose synthase
MPEEVTAADMVGMLLEHTPPQVISKADTVVSMLGVEVVIIGRGLRAAMPALQGAHAIGAHITGMAAVTGEAAIGEAVTGIRPILASASTDWAMAIHTTGLAITAIVTVDIIRTTEIGDTILTSTDSGPQ